MASTMLLVLDTDAEWLERKIFSTVVFTLKAHVTLLIIEPQSFDR